MAITNTWAILGFEVNGWILDETYQEEGHSHRFHTVFNTYERTAPAPIAILLFGGLALIIVGFVYWALALRGFLHDIKRMKQWNFVNNRAQQHQTTQKGRKERMNHISHKTTTQRGGSSPIPSSAAVLIPRRTQRWSFLAAKVVWKVWVAQGLAIHIPKLKQSSANITVDSWRTVLLLSSHPHHKLGRNILSPALRGKLGRLLNR